MANLINTLFPPIVSTFMPAFEGESVKIYFSYSPFSTKDSANILQVSIVNQKNNQNALVDTTGVLFFSCVDQESYSCVKYDKEKQLYYVEVFESQIKNGFLPEQYYKVQLRLDSGNLENALSFCKVTISDKEIPQKTTYLTAAVSSGTLSEWSSVCLIKKIYSPVLKINLFTDELGNNLQDLPSFYEGYIPLIGSVLYKESNGKSSEKIQEFQVKVFNDQNQLIFSGDTIYPEKENEITYYLNTQNFSLGESSSTNIYKILISVVTSSLFSFDKELSFQLNEATLPESEYQPFDPDTNSTVIQVNLDHTSGIASFKIKNILPLQGTLHIRRTSSKSNFTKWEDFKKIKIKNFLDEEIQDNTISPLVWYKYSYQYQNAQGTYFPAQETKLFFADFESSSLIQGDRQLNLLYNCSLSNYKQASSRTKVDTLGGQYPLFSENAILNYKQFSLSGTISSESDFNQIFLKKEQYFKSETFDEYKNYLLNNKISSIVRNDVDPSPISSLNIAKTTVNDWLWEREFREEAIKWLNNGEPKLFRSISEGVVPVILTDINLSPKNELNRMLYDFSATAYQVGDGDSVKDLIKLKILDYDDTDYSSNDYSEKEEPNEEVSQILKPGQLFNFSSEEEIFSLISSEVQAKNKLNKYTLQDLHFSSLNSNLSNFRLKNVKIFFESEPHVFFFSSNYPNGVHWEGAILDANNNNIFPINKEDLSYTPMGNIRYNQGQLKQGYKIIYKIDLGEKETSKDPLGAFINKKKYYQIPSNVDVTYLRLNTELSPNLDQATIEYVVSYNQSENSSIVDSIKGAKIAKSVVGQISDLFPCDENIGTKIKKKYNFYTSNTQQQMTYWKGLSIEARPYTVVSLEYNSREIKQYVIGQTGLFSLNKDYEVKDLCFNGQKMFKVTEALTDSYKEDLSGIEQYEFFMANQNEYVINVPYPKTHCVYETAKGTGEYKIFYFGSWYDFIFDKNNTSIGLAKIPIEAIVNYHGDVSEITWTSNDD